MSLMIRIYKSEEQNRCDNYSPIVIALTIFKLFTMIVTRPLTFFFKSIIIEQHYSFAGGFQFIQVCFTDEGRTQGS